MLSPASDRPIRKFDINVIICCIVIHVCYHGIATSGADKCIFTGTGVLSSSSLKMLKDQIDLALLYNTEKNIW